MKRILIASLLTINLAIAGWTYAQQTLPPPPTQQRINPMDLVAPIIISGSDLGFRVESRGNNVSVGKLVVRINGIWVDAQVGPSGVISATR
jgi:hypothetical protein